MTKTLSAYLERIAVEKKEVANLTEEQQCSYLKAIYEAHVKRIPYHNFALRNSSFEHPVIRRKLMLFDDRLLTTQRGGDCFQSTLMLYRMLTKLGFSVDCCAAGKSHGLMTDVVLLVHCHHKQFLLAPGLGRLTPRSSILIGDYELIRQDYDLLRFYMKNQMYVLKKLQNTQWVRVFQTDLKPLNNKQLAANLLKLERYPLTLPVRDEELLVSVVTDTGSKSLSWSQEIKAFIFVVEHRGISRKVEIDNYWDIINKLYKEFKIGHITLHDLICYCNQPKWSRPKKPWTVEFPLDEPWLRKMSLNLKG